jgi:hypothetical protein
MTRLSVAIPARLLMSQLHPPPSDQPVLWFVGGLANKLLKQGLIAKGGPGEMATRLIMSMDRERLLYRTLTRRCLMCYPE